MIKSEYSLPTNEFITNIKFFSNTNKGVYLGDIISVLGWNLAGVSKISP